MADEATPKQETAPGTAKTSVAPAPAATGSDISPAPAASPEALASPERPSGERDKEELEQHRQFANFIRSHPDLRDAILARANGKANVASETTSAEKEEESSEPKPVTDADMAVQMASQAVFASVGGGDPLKGQAIFHAEYGPAFDRVLGLTNPKSFPSKQAYVSALYQTAIRMRSMEKELEAFRKGASSSGTSAAAAAPAPEVTGGERTRGAEAPVPPGVLTIEQAWERAKKEHGVERIADLFSA